MRSLFLTNNSTISTHNIIGGAAGSKYFPSGSNANVADVSRNSYIPDKVGI